MTRRVFFQSSDCDVQSEIDTFYKLSLILGKKHTRGGGALTFQVLMECPESVFRLIHPVIHRNQQAVAIWTSAPKRLRFDPSIPYRQQHFLFVSVARYQKLTANEVHRAA